MYTKLYLSSARIKGMGHCIQPVHCFMRTGFSMQTCLVLKLEILPYPLCMGLRMSSCRVLSIACTILSPLYVGVFMCMSMMCINMCAQAWRLRSTLGVVLQELSWVVVVLFFVLCFCWDRVSCWDMVLVNYAKLSGQQATGICQSLPPQGWNYKCMQSC